MNLKSIFVYPQFPENLQRLYELAANLWSTWNYDAIDLFYRADAQVFREVNHNPLKLLHSLSKERLNDLSSDKGFLSEIEMYGRNSKTTSNMPVPSETNMPANVILEKMMQSHTFRWNMDSTNPYTRMRADWAF